jgi:hypothetical protein
MPQDAAARIQALIPRFETRQGAAVAQVMNKWFKHKKDLFMLYNAMAAACSRSVPLRYHVGSMPDGASVVAAVASVFQQELIPKVDDCIRDVHTAAGRAAGRTPIDFATQGAQVANEHAVLHDAALVAAYVLLKLVNADGVKKSVRDVQHVAVQSMQYLKLHLPADVMAVLECALLRAQKPDPGSTGSGGSANASLTPIKPKIARTVKTDKRRVLVRERAEVSAAEEAGTGCDGDGHEVDDDDGGGKGGKKRRRTTSSAALDTKYVALLCRGLSIPCTTDGLGAAAESAVCDGMVGQRVTSRGKPMVYIGRSGTAGAGLVVKGPYTTTDRAANVLVFTELVRAIDVAADVLTMLPIQSVGIVSGERLGGGDDGASDGKAGVYFVYANVLTYGRAQTVTTGSDEKLERNRCITIGEPGGCGGSRNNVQCLWGARSRQEFDSPVFGGCVTGNPRGARGGTSAFVRSVSCRRRRLGPAQHSRARRRRGSRRL